MVVAEDDEFWGVGGDGLHPFEIAGDGTCFGGERCAARRFVHEPEGADGRAVFAGEGFEPFAGVEAEHGAIAAKMILESEEAGEAEGDEGSVAESFAVESDQFAAGCAPGVGEGEPIFVFVVAANENDFLDVEAGEEFGAFLRGPHVACGSVIIERVAEASEDVGLMAFESGAEFVEERGIGMEVGDGEEFEGVVHFVFGGELKFKLTDFKQLGSLYLNPFTSVAV